MERERWCLALTHCFLLFFKKSANVTDFSRDCGSYRGKELESSTQLSKEPLLSTERLFHFPSEEHGRKGKASPSGVRQKQKEKKRREEKGKGKKRKGKRNVQGSYNKQVALYTCVGTRSELPHKRVSQLHTQAFCSPKCPRKFHIVQIARWSALRTSIRLTQGPPMPCLHREEEWPPQQILAKSKK